jgi:hypothetical protein
MNNPVNPTTGLDFTPAVGDMPFTLQRALLTTAHALGRDKLRRVPAVDRGPASRLPTTPTCARPVSSSSACPRRMAVWARTTPPT